MSYLRDPAKIYRKSFAIIAREVDLSRFPEELHNIVIRLVHSTGMPEIVDDIFWKGDVAGAARIAFRKEAPVIVDSTMVDAGINKDNLPVASKIICTLSEENVSELALTLATTRSAAAVELWRPYLKGSIISIGNAPTALFHLIDMLQDAKCPRPAAIFGFPVGFVGAAESKAYLADKNRDIPFITLHGRKGGSALAAAAINAILFEGDL